VAVIRSNYANEAFSAADKARRTSEIKNKKNLHAISIYFILLQLYGHAAMK